MHACRLPQRLRIPSSGLPSASRGCPPAATMAGAHLHSARASAGLATPAMIAASALRATSGPLSCQWCPTALNAAWMPLMHTSAQYGTSDQPMTPWRDRAALPMPCTLRGSCLSTGSCEFGMMSHNSFVLDSFRLSLLVCIGLGVSAHDM